MRDFAIVRFHHRRASLPQKIGPHPRNQHFRKSDPNLPKPVTCKIFEGLSHWAAHMSTFCCSNEVPHLQFQSRAGKHMVNGSWGNYPCIGHPGADGWALIYRSHQAHQAGAKGLFIKLFHVKKRAKRCPTAIRPQDPQGNIKTHSMILTCFGRN